LDNEVKPQSTTEGVCWWAGDDSLLHAVKSRFVERRPGDFRPLDSDTSTLCGIQITEGSRPFRARTSCEACVKLWQQMPGVWVAPSEVGH
jgi:hypothetical protein